MVVAASLRQARLVRGNRLGATLAKLFLIATLCGPLPAAAGDAKRPFTVRDSIEWTYVLPLSTDAHSSARDVALFSPDRAHFILHTRRGDLARNVNVESLLLYRAQDIEVGAVPQAMDLVSINAIRDEDSLAGVQWLSESRVGWVAKAPDGRKQAFAADVGKGGPIQLTASRTDVVGFAQAADVIAYYACVPYIREQPSVVRVESFAEALPPMDNSAAGCYQTTPIELYVQRGTQPAVRIPLPAMRLFPHLKQIWIAPSGDKAVILAPAVNAPASWAQYAAPNHGQLGYGPEWAREDATSMDLINRTRYLLVDLRRDTVRPLLNAPSGQISANYTPAEVYWPKNEQSVIVSNTYLPLDGIAGEVRAQRAARPAIAEVDIASGAATVVEWEAVPPDLQTPLQSSIVAYEWDRSADRLTVIHERVVDRASTANTYSRQGGEWRASAAEAATQRRRLSVEQYQALNERPKIYVRSSRSAKRTLLFDPNPRAEKIAFGKTRVFKWRDANGTDWAAGLLLPPSHTPGTRYPLVVQTHGFAPSKFLLDGPAYDGQGGTAFAAQAFANAGFIVLQIEDNPGTITLDEREGSAVAEGFSAAIERLIREGLVDPSSIGLIAFSRTGYHALHLIARHPSLLAALALSDTLHAGYSIFLYNINTPASADLARLTQGNPTVPTIGEWFARNPVYALGRSRAAVRLENMGLGLGLWEPYVVLKQASRPVEFVVYPDGSHVLQKPQERLSSQGGTVDWFRFWLQGYEDPDPGKADQYTRWRMMREAAPK